MYKIIITIIIFFVSCTSQQAKQATTQTSVKFTHKYTWVNNDQEEATAKDTVIYIETSNRVTIESREDGTEYREDADATNNVEVAEGGKITAYTVYTSDSTGVTYFKQSNNR